MTDLDGPAADYRTEGGQLRWGQFLKADLADIDWITEPLLAEGQQAALVAEGKAGKSLFCLEWACAMAAGRAFLGNPGREPITVLYVDLENGHDEIQRRIRALGYDRPELLDRLVYLSFPPAPMLDTAEGASWLLRQVEEYQPRLMFLDTVSRMIQGEENSADTWLKLYRHSLMPLKRRKVATVRLDHMGKDSERGARGSSAKTQDVDSVWELAKGTGDLLRLNRTHTRSGLGEDRLTIRRLGRAGEAGTTRHVPAGGFDGGPASFVPVEVERFAKLLDGAGIPSNASRRAVNEALTKLNGKGVSNDLGSQIAAYRKQQGNNSAPQEWSQDHRSPDTQPDLWDHSGPETSLGRSDRSRTTPGPLGPPGGPVVLTHRGRTTRTSGPEPGFEGEPQRGPWEQTEGNCLGCTRPLSAGLVAQGYTTHINGHCER